MNKFTAAAAALLALALTAPAFAADDVANKALDSLELHMGSAYSCQPVVGVSYIEDVRTTALTSLEAFGMGEDDAAMIIARAEAAVKQQAAANAATIAAQPVQQASEFCATEFARTGEVMTVAMANFAEAYN